MDKSRLEWKVGLFVAIGLALLAALLIQFSKGTTFFRPGYNLYLSAPTVGGLKVRGQVLMSGIQIGSVARMQLTPAGTNVIITLRIFQQYKIFKDAAFSIEQSGFLGDQFIAIRPTLNQGPVFQPGEEATVVPPLDLLEVAGKAAHFLERIDAGATNITEALSTARSTAFSAQSFTNLALVFTNLLNISDRSLTVISNVQAFVETKQYSLGSSITNLQILSQQATQLAGRLDALVVTNSPDITLAISNLRATASNLNELTEGVKQGRGLAGALLVDTQLAATVSQIISNVNDTTAQLSITSSNLNRRGLWGILWKQKPPRTNTAAAARGPLTSPKNPFN